MTLPRAERGEKEIRTDWPHEQGIDNFETQTRVGRVYNLVAQAGSKVLSRYKVLI